MAGHGARAVGAARGGGGGAVEATAAIGLPLPRVKATVILVLQVLRRGGRLGLSLLGNSAKPAGRGGGAALWLLRLLLAQALRAPLQHRLEQATAALKPVLQAGVVAPAAGAGAVWCGAVWRAAVVAAGAAAAKAAAAVRAAVGAAVRAAIRLGRRRALLRGQIGGSRGATQPRAQQAAGAAMLRQAQAAPCRRADRRSEGTSAARQAELKQAGEYGLARARGGAAAMRAGDRAAAAPHLAPAALLMMLRLAPSAPPSWEGAEPRGLVATQCPSQATPSSHSAGALPPAARHDQ